MRNILAVAAELSATLEALKTQLCERDDFVAETAKKVEAAELSTAVGPTDLADEFAENLWNVACKDTPEGKLRKFEDELQKVTKPLQIKVYDAQTAKEFDTATAFKYLQKKFASEKYFYMEI